MGIGVDKPWRSSIALCLVVLTSVLAVGCRGAGGPSATEEREKTQLVAGTPDPSPAEPGGGDPGPESQGGYSGPYGDPRPCAGSLNEELCRKGAPSFDVRCAACHGMRGVQERKGPSLAGLVGRKRVFLSGQSVVADEAYIRRSIIDHSSDAEYVPGWKGTFYRTRAMREGREDWLDFAHHREKLSWDDHVVGSWTPLTPAKTDAIVAYVMALSPANGFRGLVSYEIEGEDDDVLDEDQIRKEIEMRLESIDQCYETERARETEMPSGSRIGGQVTLRLNGLRNHKDVVASGSIGNEFVLACAVDAIADVVGSSPYLGLPSDAIAVVLKFVQTDADRQRPRWWLHQL
jgi:hypothetical protein